MMAKEPMMPVVGDSPSKPSDDNPSCRTVSAQWMSSKTEASTMVSSVESRPEKMLKMVRVELESMMKPARATRGV
jgi:hypothetical protein